jgi:CDP-2,3-bis-(O-geranylgeranyl)-sn-glycerol synthase
MVRALVLLLAANGAPVLVNNLLGRRWVCPVDNGLKLKDGHRLFGDTKTWRGVFAGMCLTTSLAIFCDTTLLTGVLFGFWAMIGDLLASFGKRRLGYTESNRARGLDTVLESLLPLLILKEPLALSVGDITVVVGIFFLIEEFVSPVLYRWHIRNKPY